MDDYSEQRIFSVYRHFTEFENTIMSYVGQTRQKPKKRFKNGKGYDKQPFGKVIKKIGWNKFDHEIIGSGLTGQEADALEIEQIDKYNSTDPRFGFNILKGGHRPPPLTEEFKAHLSEINKGANSPVARSVICLNTLKVYPTIAEAAIDTNSNKTCINGVCIGRHYSVNGLFFSYYDSSKPMDYYKDLLVKKQKEREEHFFTQEHRDKIAEKRSIPVICLDTHVIYSSAKEAEKEHGLCVGVVTGCCKGRIASAGNLHFAYYDSDKTEQDYDVLLEEVKKRKCGRKVKAVICKETSEVYESAEIAGKSLGVSYTSILKCCKGNRERAGGYHWAYVE